MTRAEWLERVRSEVRRLKTNGTSRYIAATIVVSNANPEIDPSLDALIDKVIDEEYSR